MCIWLAFSDFRFPESKLARMFNGSIPIVLDTLKQHYFIDRDGKSFRYVLNFLRTSRLTVPDNFSELETLLEEARFYDVVPMVEQLEAARNRRAPPGAVPLTSHRIKVEKENGCYSNCNASISSDRGDDEQLAGNMKNGGDYWECVAVSISPDLGERISLSAERPLIDEVFPELSGAIMDSRNSGWHLDNRFVIRFPLNGFCKLNSVQVIQRLINHDFAIVASNGGGVEGQQFSEYLLSRKVRSAQWMSCDALWEITKNSWLNYWKLTMWARGARSVKCRQKPCTKDANVCMHEYLYIFRMYGCMNEHLGRTYISMCTHTNIYWFMDLTDSINNFVPHEDTFTAIKLTTTSF